MCLRFVVAGDPPGAPVVAVVGIVVVVYLHSYTSAAHAKLVELSHASASGSHLAFTPSQVAVMEVGVVVVVVIREMEEVDCNVVPELVGVLVGDVDGVVLGEKVCVLVGLWVEVALVVAVVVAVLVALLVTELVTVVLSELVARAVVEAVPGTIAAMHAASLPALPPRITSGCCPSPHSPEMSSLCPVVFGATGCFSTL